MAFSLPTEVLPKALATGLVAYGVISFFLTGPEVAARVAEFDHGPACKAHYGELVQKAAEAEKQSLPQPSSETDMGIDYLGGLMNNEMVQALGQFGGFGGAMNNAMAQARAKQKALREEYERRVAEIDAATRRKLANSHGFCGCVADAAIDNSRQDWAIYAGSFGTLTPSKVENFGTAMTNPDNLAKCASSGKENV